MSCAVRREVDMKGGGKERKAGRRGEREVNRL